jgi:hypothetical protein
MPAAPGRPFASCCSPMGAKRCLFHARSPGSQPLSPLPSKPLPPGQNEQVRIALGRPPLGRGLRILSMDGGGMKGMAMVELLRQVRRSRAPHAQCPARPQALRFRRGAFARRARPARCPRALPSRAPTSAPRPRCRQIERRAGRPIWQLFDVIGGTSTGALLAVALVGPGRRAGPRACDALPSPHGALQARPRGLRAPRVLTAHPASTPGHAAPQPGRLQRHLHHAGPQGGRGSCWGGFWARCLITAPACRPPPRLPPRTVLQA